MLSKRERIFRARIALERGAQISPSLLSPHIAESWSRCFNNGLNPRDKGNYRVLTAPELGERRANSEDLRRFALGEMEALYQQISGTSYMIALGDKDCVILDTICDENFARTEQGKAIKAGSHWSEFEGGTNGLGTCAIVKHPIIVHGHEHYFTTHSDLSCIAAPIFHSDGKMAGILDASSDCRKRQHHTHALIRMAATYIENSLFTKEQDSNLVFMFHSRNEFLNPVSGGLVSFDEKGRLITGNQRAKELLSGLEMREGCHFEDLFDVHFAQVLKRFRGVPYISLHDHVGSRYIVRWINMHHWERDYKEKSIPLTKTDSAVTKPTSTFIAEDPIFQDHLRQAAKGVRLKVPIMVLGETGTGKEVMARYIHDISGRKGQFVAVNCGAIPRELFEAEMFGYAAGAFTSASKEGNKGLILNADKGTLFLDEIGDLPPASQSALLRFLDNYEVRGIGKAKSISVDVQIISATNVNIAKAVDDKKFRADLYYRINVIQLMLPPLREREDFKLLARHLVQSISKEITITDGAIERLSHQLWPGNLRELRSVLTRLALNMNGTLINSDLLSDYLPLNPKEEIRFATSSLKSKTRFTVQSALKKYDGNITRVAKSLNVSRTTIYKYLSK